MNFDDPRSQLFFIAADIKDKLQAKNPDLWFLMENVRMEKWCERIITERLQVDPVFIDSARVSAQTRKRLYWTNIPVIGKPKDLGIYLKDILEGEVDKKYQLSEKAIARIDRRGTYSMPKIDPLKAGCVTQDNNSARLCMDAGTTLIDVTGKPKQNQFKAGCFTAGGHSGGHHSDMDLIVTHSLQPRNGKGSGGKGHLAKTNQKSYCVDTGNGQAVQLARVGMQQLAHGKNQGGERAINGKTPSVTESSWEHNNFVYKQNYVQWDVSGKGHNSQQDRAWYADGKSGCDAAARTENKVNVLVGSVIRRLTEIEVERLQTVDDNYTAHVSPSQRYKMLGNGWTVDVIVWILMFMKTGEPRNGIAQHNLFE